MPVEPSSPVQFSAIRSLCQAANSKNQFSQLGTDGRIIASRPFKFIGNMRTFTNEAAMLAWFEAENGEEVIAQDLFVPVAVAIRRDTRVAYELVNRPYSLLSSWQVASWFKVTQGTTPSGVAGDFWYEMFSGQIRYRSAKTNAWELYNPGSLFGGWKSELRRLRSACIDLLWPQSGSLPPVERNGELYVSEPPWIAYNLFQNQYWPYGAGSVPGVTGGISASKFRELRYIYPTGGPSTEVRVSASFRCHSTSLPGPGPTDRQRVRFTIKSNFGPSFGARINGTWYFDIGLRGSSTLPFPRYEVVRNDLSFAMEEVRLTAGGLNQIRLLFTATDIPWDGAEWVLEVRHNEDPTLFQVVGFDHAPGPGKPDPVVSYVCRDILRRPRIIPGFHPTSPKLRVIDVPDFPNPEEDRPPWIWSKTERAENVAWPPEYEPHDHYWSSALARPPGLIDADWSAAPVGDTSGIFIGKPVPLYQVDFDEFQNKAAPIGVVMDSVLQRYARDATYGNNNPSRENISTLIPSNPIGADYSAGGGPVIIYALPKLAVQRIVSGTAPVYHTSHMAFRGDLIHRNGIIYSITISRLAQQDDSNGMRVPVMIGPGLSVDIGCVLNVDPPAFNRVTSVLLPEDQESVTFFPSWPIFGGVCLAYRCAEQVDIKASCVAVNVAVSGLITTGVNDLQEATVNPVMAFHYNDTEMMLSRIT